MGKFKDLTGTRYGLLTVVGRVENSKNGSSRWLCRCDCGNERIHSAGTLNYGVVFSCGCYGKERRLQKQTTHGKSKTKLYRVWSSMKDRCSRPSCKAFKYYGGKGISLCKEWMDYQTFYDWAMANGYAEGLTIDRIDVNGNYEPSNCRWATRGVQANNTTANRLLDCNGVSHTASEWSRIVGIPYTRLMRRLGLGWSIEKALFTEVKRSVKSD